MRKLLLILIVPLLVMFASSSTSFAAPSWGKVVDNIESTMLKAHDTYKKGDIAKAKDQVNEAYFNLYEKEGMERAINSKISAKRASIEEYKFSTIKKLMTNKAPEEQVKKEITELIKMMREDVVQMGGGKQQSSFEVFLPAFLILLREGFEAILVIAAIAAYLVKSGNGEKTRVVYYSSVAAIAASLLTAVLLQMVFSISGASQEILEGATMLLAVVVLFSVSHWMVGKAEAGAWKNYIEGKVQQSISGGSTFSLGAAAFLAVYREGAETVLFYQALVSDAGDHMNMIWLGFAAGSIALAAVFALIRFGSMKIPLKPFFMGTSTLMYILAISFAGGGVKELQEAGVVSVTAAPVPTIDLLGVYPTWETLLPQIVLVLLAIGGVMYQRRKATPEVSA